MNELRRSVAARWALAATLLLAVGCGGAPPLTIADSARDADNEALVDHLYTAFAQRDAVAMKACYADDAVFIDPVFGELHGAVVPAMWAMLCDRGQDLKIYHWGVRADPQRGKAHWEAFYTFSATGGRIHNVIDARFRFRDGKIVEHRDYFDLWAWTRMAVGPYLGDLFGWSPLLQVPLGMGARSALEDWMASHSS